MAPTSKPRTFGSTTFDPDAFFDAWRDGVAAPLQDNDLRTAIIKSFGLKPKDDFVYHAIASVTLAQVQQAVNAGAQGGLHAWYRDDNGQPIDPPPQADIDAYTAIFSSTTSTSKALVGLKSNAKKGSLRASIANHLTSLYAPIDPSRKITVPKLKTPHVNPYLDWWNWSCRNLEWAGPDENTVNVRQSHHILPIFYHHFGCICPTYESLEIIKQVANGRGIVDMGSGNGYWTYMLRRMGVTVRAVDNELSEWRTMWIGDTVVADGIEYLGKNGGGADTVLLLVYPQVSAEFTKKVIEAYKGGTIVVAGTQNANGYTAFKDKTMDKWMEDNKPDWEKICQIPLPSFAGKDEALFVFEKRS